MHMSGVFLGVDLMENALQRLCRWMQMPAGWNRHEGTETESVLPLHCPRYHWTHRSSCSRTDLMREEVNLRD